MPRYPSQSISQDLAEQLQVLDTRFLLAIHHGDVSMADLARRELASRGIDGSGRWVGFALAGGALGI